MPLSKDRDTLQKNDDKLHSGPVAAATTIYAGALVALDASGNIVPGTTATTLKFPGRAEEYVNNSAGLAGDKKITFKKGVFQYANSAAGDEITRADIGNNCYIVDDSTVAKTNGANTRSVAGKIMDVDAGGVWVKFD
ncbi:hypothetical protein [Micavibrio aeruginosavorus]|uniref:hypothetical protein n=1 Tax=Micavibrio aeruginosavorus TaxID=349221 RepID=UPI003F4AD818